MTSMRWLLYACGLLLLALMVVEMQEGVRMARDRGSHSTFSTDPGGSAALYRLLDETGYSVGRSQDPHAVEPGPGVFVVMLASDELPNTRDIFPGEDPSAELSKRLIDLASGGKSVAILGLESAPPGLLTGLDLDTATVTGPLECVNPSMAGLPPFAEPGEYRLTAKSRAWIPLVATDGKPFLLARKCGDGWLYACASASAFENDSLAKDGHAEFATRLIALAAKQSKDVAFDEFVHGYGDTGVWARIGRSGRATVWQLLIVFSVIVFSIGRRFGYPVARRTPPPPLGEYVSAIAHLYERASAPGLALRTIRKQATRRAAQAVGLPRGVDEAMLLKRLPESLRQALEDIGRAADGKTTPDAAAKLCRNLDREIEALDTSQRGVHS
jgi:hypothetical protein